MIKAMSTRESRPEKNQDACFGATWVLFGVLHIVSYYYTQLFWPNQLVTILLAAVLVLLLYAMFFSLSKFLPEGKLNSALISIWAVSDLVFMFARPKNVGFTVYATAGGPLLYALAMALMAITLAIVLGKMIKEGIWALWVPIAVGVLIRSLPVLFKDYRVNKDIFQILYSLVFIAVGILYISRLKEKRVPFGTVWAVLIVLALAGSFGLGVFGVSNSWSVGQATRQAALALNTDLPESAVQTEMQYSRNIEYSKLYISFYAPEDAVRRWIEKGVLGFALDLDDFYTGEALLVSAYDMNSALDILGSNSAADVYVRFSQWDYQLIKKLKPEEGIFEYADICGIDQPGEIPYFIWVSASESVMMLVQILSQR